MGEWPSGRITDIWENHHLAWTGFVGAEGEKRRNRAPVPHAVGINRKKLKSKFKILASRISVCYLHEMKCISESHQTKCLGDREQRERLIISLEHKSKC